MNYRTERVLMVDDDPQWLSLVTGILKRTDEIEQIVGVSSVIEAIDAIAVFRPSIVVTDLRLSPEDDDDMGGLEVCRIARESDPSIPVVMITGLAWQGQPRLLDPGVLILDKAVLSADELRETIRSAAVLRRTV